MARPSHSIGHPDQGNIVNLYAYRRKLQAPPLAPAMSIEEAMIAAMAWSLPKKRRRKVLRALIERPWEPTGRRTADPARLTWAPCLLQDAR